MDDTRLSHLKNLMIIALADGVLDPMEKEFIIEKASMLGIEEKELKEMFKEALNFNQKTIQTSVRKEEQMADAILMAVLDGYLHENEQKILHELGTALGFSRDYVDEIIQKSFKIWKSPPEKGSGV
jgi:tellurite resistance protein